MKKLRWRFPTVTGGQAQGLTTGDKETFKKVPYISLAREVLQNSIDVGICSDKPVEVEFNSFIIETDKIPDIEGFKAQLSRCIRFWKHMDSYVEIYTKMVDLLNQKEINCLRISDFNTSGLRGINSQDFDDNRFIALTKGTGVSVKSSATAGGSKGVGKNAVITLSHLGLIFYSTITDHDEIGSIGVASLISGFPDDETVDTNTFTQGQGYYSKNDQVLPLDTLTNLDNTFNRNGRSGTDIFIIGFKSEKDWEKEVITSVIDSFLVAIHKEKLKVKVNDIIVDKDNLNLIINGSDYITDKNKKNSAICGLRLLNGDGDVYVFEIETDYGKPILYVLPIEKNEEEIATRSCSMIRYPYMQIKQYRLNSSFRVAAMCIIGDDDLGALLRSIENPEHTDWYVKAIDDSSLRKEVKWVINSIEEQIDNYVLEVMQQGDEGSIDPARAGEFLPAVESGNSNSKSGNSGRNTDVEETYTTQFKPNIHPENKLPVNDEPGKSLVPDIGSTSDEPGNDPFPDGENTGDGGYVKPGPNDGTIIDGDSVILKNIDKSAIRYKFIVIDKHTGKYRIVFTSPINHEKCFLNLYMLDDSNNRTIIHIKEITCDGLPIEFENSKEVGPFKIYTNKKSVIEVQTESMNGLFGSEVRIICK